MTKRESLPPMPGGPKRSLSPPARRAVSGIFDLDAKTPPKNETWQHFQGLANLFDSMNNLEREDVTELGAIYKELTPHRRLVLMCAARKLLEHG